MRVCHVITKLELGGAQLSTLNILSGLRDKYDLSLITSSKGILRSEAGDLKGVGLYFSRFLTRPINPLVDICGFIHIYLIYRRNKYNIVHTHSSKAGIIGRWAARLAGVPVILHTVHGWSFNDYQSYPRKMLFMLLERLTARITTRIICVSNRDVETALNHGIAPADKFKILRYGIPLAEFRKTSKDIPQKRKELGIPGDGPVVGMISCLKPQKAPLDYIRASAKIHEKVPEASFLLVGDGALRARCEKALAATRLNGRFVLTGWRRDVSEILDVLDVMVLTSKWEGMPISVIEALSKGCPVVATDAGGTAELVKNGVTGYIVRPGSYDELAEKVIRIIKDNGRYARMRQEASLSIDDSFSLDKMLEEIKELYRKLS